MGAESELLGKSHEKDFAAFRRGVKKSPYKALLWLVLILLLGTLFVFSQASKEEVERFQLVRSELLAMQAPWAINLVETHAAEREWLERRGLGFEVRLYDQIAKLTFNSAISMGDYYSSDSFRGMVVRAMIAVHAPVLRVSFLIIACWRVWVVAFLLTLVWGVTSVTPYEGADMLGQTGNGRLYYSGIRADLKKHTETGAPDLQVTGLACPAAVPPKEAQDSALGKLLEHCGALNETNLSLAAIILNQGAMPAYAPDYGEDSAVDSYYLGATLAENALLVLDKALALHRHYQTAPDQDAEHLLLEQGKADAAVSTLPVVKADGSLLPVVQGERGKIDKERYAAMLQQAFHRVLTREMQQELAGIAPHELATTVLACEAGKVLAYAFERGKWLRKSRFPQLCARAVLHSVPAYGKEYDFDSRSLIRRGIVYALRKSVFGPVRFPVDLPPRTQALRQWVELLIAAPQELEAASDEVELYGLISQTHTAWEKRLLDGIMNQDRQVLDGAFSSKFNILFMPVGSVLKLMRAVIDANITGRLAQLIAQVSQRQKLRMAAGKSPSGEDDAVLVPDYERIPAPFSQAEIKSFASQYSLAVEQVRDWSAYRVILNAYGWLGKRVGNATIVDDCLVFGVFGVDEPVSGRNDLGLVGRPGMVVMRGTRLSEVWGPAWQAKFIKVRTASIAQSKDDYDSLMRGVKEVEKDESGDMAAV